MLIKKLRFLVLFALINNQINSITPLHAMQPNQKKEERLALPSKSGSFLWSLLSKIKQIFSTTHEQTAPIPIIIDLTEEETSTERKTKPRVPKRKAHSIKEKYLPGKRQKVQYHQAQSETIDPTLETNNLHFKNIPSLEQNDNWSCGYFAIFHGMQMLQRTQQNLILDNLDLSSEQETFNDWLENICKKSDDIQNLHQNKRLLMTGNIEWLISLSNTNKPFKEIDNISIIERANFYINKLLPTSDGHTIKNVKNFKETGNPQLIIIHESRHWTACLLTKEGMWRANSMSSDNKINKFEKEIYTFFTSKNLIDHQTFKILKQEIRNLLSTNTEDSEADKQALVKKYKITDTELAQLFNEIEKSKKEKETVILT